MSYLNSPVLAPAKSTDLSECLDFSNFLVDFTVYCDSKRVDPFIQLMLPAVGFNNIRNSALQLNDKNEQNQYAFGKLAGLKNHLLFSNSNEYTIVEQSTNEYSIELAVAAPANGGPGDPAVTETWTLGTASNNEGLADAYFVPVNTVLFWTDASDPTNVKHEAIFVQAKDTAANTITVVRNYDGLGTYDIPAGATLNIGLTAFEECSQTCETECTPKVKPCTRTAHIQMFESCESICKSWFAKAQNLRSDTPIDLVADMRKQAMNDLIFKLTKTVYGSTGGTIINSEGMPIYTMNGLEYYRQFAKKRYISGCCYGTFDEIVAEFTNNTYSEGLQDNDNIIIALSSTQAMNQLRGQQRRNLQTFQNLNDLRASAPGVSNIAYSIRGIEPVVYYGAGFYIVFIESPMYTEMHPFEQFLIPYNLMWWVTIREQNFNFGGESYPYGTSGIMRTVSKKNPVTAYSSRCPMIYGYEGSLNLEIFCPENCMIIKWAECNSCDNTLVINPDTVPPGGSGAVPADEL